MPIQRRRLDVCRGCGIELPDPKDRVFMDECNRPTPFPVCRDCYERSIRTCGASEQIIPKDPYRFTLGRLDIPRSDAVYHGRLDNR